MTKCISVGQTLLKKDPFWYLGYDSIVNWSEIDILGVCVNQSIIYEKHVENRTKACRGSIFRLTSIGMSYPGLRADAKAYIWNSVGAPALLYAIECIPLSISQSNHIKYVQGSIIKKVIGFSKRSHHSPLVHALDISTTEELI